MIPSHPIPPSPSPPSPPPPDYYTPIPSQQDQNHFHHHKLRITIIISLLLLAALVYFLWPSDPSLRISHLRLNKIQFHTLPIINIDISLHFTVQVQNVDIYYLNFNTLEVAVSYRGKKLGVVRSHGGQVRALASSYVDAELEFSGVGVLADVFFLLEDLAKGTVPFDTVTEFDGKLGLLFFEFPLKAKMSCEILVNPNNQTIARQNCYPEFSELKNL